MCFGDVRGLMNILVGVGFVMNFLKAQVSIIRFVLIVVKEQGGKNEEIFD